MAQDVLPPSMKHANLPKKTFEKSEKPLDRGRTFDDTLPILNMKHNLDWKRIKDLEVDGIDFKDAPEFSDAYFSAGVYVEVNGSVRDLTEEELEWLTSTEPQWLYEKVVARVW